MPDITRSWEDILARPCLACGEAIDDDQVCTFTRDESAPLHLTCADISAQEADELALLIEAVGASRRPDAETLSCAVEDCGRTTLADPRHIPNLLAAGPWLCPTHKRRPDVALPDVSEVPC